MCERKKREERERWEEMARNAKTEGQVWDMVNRERKRWSGISGRIKKGEWVKYFREILGGVEGRVVRGKRGGWRDNSEEEITREEMRGR